MPELAQSRARGCRNPGARGCEDVGCRAAAVKDKPCTSIYLPVPVPRQMAFGSSPVTGSGREVCPRGHPPCQPPGPGGIGPSGAWGKPHGQFEGMLWTTVCHGSAQAGPMGWCPGRAPALPPQAGQGREPLATVALAGEWVLSVSQPCWQRVPSSFQEPPPHPVPASVDSMGRILARAPCQPTGPCPPPAWPGSIC